MYCVYLTVYKGNKLPPFYIGSTFFKNIQRGYKGSVSSKKYYSIWKFERKCSPELFKIKILKTFSTRQAALTYEQKLHEHLNVVNNPLYINQSNAFGPKGKIIPWNKGKKGVQIPWNKGKMGLQKAWNKGKPNPIAKKKMLENNPSKNEVSKLKMIKTKLNQNGREMYSTWTCKHCGDTKEVINNVKNMKKRFCNQSCATTYRNIHGLNRSKPRNQPHQSLD